MTPSARRLPLFVLALIASLALAPRPAAQVIAAGDGEEWFVISMDGAPAGYMQVISEPIDDGLFSIFNQTRIRIARMGTQLEILVEQTQVEDEHGHVLRLSSRTTMPGEVRSSAVVEGDTLHIVVEELTGQRSFDQEWQPDVRGSRHDLRQLLAWAADAEVGGTRQGVGYDLTLGSALTTTYTLTERDRVYITVSAVTDLMPGMPTVMRMHLDGSDMVLTSNMMGIEMTMAAATQSEAFQAFQSGGVGAEVFAQTVLVPDVPLPRPRSLDRVVYRLESKNTAIPWPDLSAPNQRILERSPEALVLEVTRHEPGIRTAPDPISGPISKPDASFREPNTWIQSDDPSIIALAARYAGDADDPWTIARRLERGVENYIDKKSMGVAFATASEVCRDRTGDCTEHAVLLASLCRARDIPARVTMGLVYLGGIFGGHAWTEVWIEDDWYALDAVFGLGHADPTHLRFASSALDGVGMAARCSAL